MTNEREYIITLDVISNRNFNARKSILIIITHKSQTVMIINQSRENQLKQIKVTRIASQNNLIERKQNQNINKVIEVQKLLFFYMQTMNIGFRHRKEKYVLLLAVCVKKCGDFRERQLRVCSAYGGNVCYQVTVTISVYVVCHTEYTFVVVTR